MKWDWLFGPPCETCGRYGHAAEHHCPGCGCAPDVGWALEAQCWPCAERQRKAKQAADEEAKLDRLADKIVSRLRGGE